jgi:hypothetical protein
MPLFSYAIFLRNQIMAHIIKPPEALLFDPNQPSLFLAGSIEMGSAIDWQNSVEIAFKDYQITILNPRRENWDASWQQSIDNPDFRQQVEWELSARSGKLIVCCPDGYWRKGNVDIVCQRYKIETAVDLPRLIAAVKKRLDGVKGK